MTLIDWEKIHTTVYIYTHLKQTYCQTKVPHICTTYVSKMYDYTRSILVSVIFENFVINYTTEN